MSTKTRISAIALTALVSLTGIVGPAATAMAAPAAGSTIGALAAHRDDHYFPVHQYRDHRHGVHFWRDRDYVSEVYCTTKAINSRFGPTADSPIVRAYRPNRPVALAENHGRFITAYGWSNELQANVEWIKLAFQDGWVRSDLIDLCY